MTLRIVGAGLPRTGTRSLKTALERLLGGPCYHMGEVFLRPDHVDAWHRGARGEPVDWQRVLGDYVAAVDFPAAVFWEELAARHPDALVLLSHREPEDWWRSADRTILEVMRSPSRDPAFHAMAEALMVRCLTPRFLERDAAIAAAARHVAHVRATVPPERLVEWRPGDGWDPLCGALGVPVPDEPFPHLNSEAEFRERMERMA